MKRPDIDLSEGNIVPMLETGYLNVYDLQYAPGRHYYDASRRKKGDIVCLKDDEAARAMTPDAVSCVVVLKVRGEEPRLLMSYEFRYPAGRFMLGVPAGLIDPADRALPDPVLTAAAREIHEETGIEIKETDTLRVLNPFLFSTPGMTDESNALVLAVVDLEDLSGLTQAGAETTECFAGFELLTKQTAREALETGRDKYGNFYSMYTWAGLMVFVNDMWK